MDKRKKLCLALALAVVGSPAAAHHSVNAQFDVARFVSLTGTLTQLELINPHSYIHLDVKNADGKVEKWDIETGTPAALRRMGIAPREAFKVGTSYTVRVHPARNGTTIGLLNSLTLPDGRLVQFGAEKSLQ